MDDAENHTAAGKACREAGNPPLQPITLHLREDLARAFRRCTWMIIHETGRTQLDIMEEMVRDFLVKHGC